MGGWIPAGVDGWPEWAEWMTDAGREWPKEAAATDLRWWVDRRAGELRGRGNLEPSAADLVKGIPGRPTLVARWRWTDWKVKQFLKETSEWWDARRWGDAPTPADRQGSTRKPPADRQPTASAPPAHRQPPEGSTSTIEDIPPADRQRTASAPPADRHARGDHNHNHNHNHNTQGVVPADEPPAPAAGALTPQDTASGPEPEVGPSPAQVAWDEAIRLWVEEVGTALGRRLVGPDRSSSTGKKLATALKRRPADMHDAMRFVAHAETGDWHRETLGPKLSIETVIRHREKYAAAWREEQETAARQPAQPTAAPRRALVAPDESPTTPTIKPPPVRVAAK